MRRGESRPRAAAAPVALTPGARAEGARSCYRQPSRTARA